MQNIKFLPILILMVISVCFIGCSSDPDVIYTNGKIYTMDDNNSVVEAIAVKDGKILDLGTASEISEKYKTGEVIDLGGKVVIPGLIDTDANLFIFSRNLDLVNLAGATSVEQIKNLLREKIANSPNDEWIGGYGFNPELFPEGDIDLIDMQTLDEVSTDKNIYLIDNLNITLWGNSKLFQTVGISPETQAPENGEIILDENGELLGLLAGSAISFVSEKVPQINEEKQKKLL